MRCELCNHEFVPHEHFVVDRKDDGKEVFMCETCFFDLALKKLNYKELQMNNNGTKFYYISDDYSEEEWDS